MINSQLRIKELMSKWLHRYIYEVRQQGKLTNKAKIAKILGCAPSCLSQYLNPNYDKKAPWEFQCKLCYLVGHTMIELHPELNDIRLMHN
jgi:hypothetical protein